MGRMAYRPQFPARPALLTRVEAIAAPRKRRAAVAVQVAWIPARQKDARVREVTSP